MITATIRRDNADEEGIECEFTTIPRIGETISIPNKDGVECDLRVKGINHWCRKLEGKISQSEIVIFCAPTITIY